MGKCKADVETIEIKPNSEQDYFYEKAEYSLSGCAGVQTFTVYLSASSKLSFLVAFRNYTVQIRKKSQNKVVIVHMSETWDQNTKIDVRSFNEIMKDDMSSSTFKYLDGCYQSNECNIQIIVCC